MRLIVRIERAALHPGVAVIFSGRSKHPLAQVPSAEVEKLLEGRQFAYYWAREANGGVLHLGEEVPEEEVPK